MQPCFSVIIPVFNGEQRLAATLDSVCRQTFGDFEIVVIDDGSKDHTSDVALAYCENSQGKVRYFYKNNGGVSSARNLGMIKAVGEFVVFLDSDDFLDENYLNRMYYALTDSERDWVCCVNKENGHCNLARFSYRDGEDVLAHILGGGTLPQTACWAIRKSVLMDSGIFFDESISYTEDYNFFCKFLYYTQSVGSKGYYLKEPLVDYTLRYGSLCQRERGWLDLKHLEEDFESTKDIYQYIASSEQPRASRYLELLLGRLKKKYLYNLWGVLLLSDMADFKCLRHLYEEDVKKYSLRDVKLGLKYSIWEWATRPGICYLSLMMRPYKRFQKSRQRKNIL